MDVKRRMDAGEPLLLVDVREPHETAAGIIEGAVAIPPSELEARIGAIVSDKQRPIVTYCASGPRAVRAAQQLEALGYEDVASAESGFPRWKALGYPVATRSSLTEAQEERYARHLSLPEIGVAGQEALLGKKVLLVGAGGLGSPAAMYLAAAGVGTLGVVDADVVDASNLQRQVLHTTTRLGMPKVESATKALADLNPDVRVEAHRERLTSANVERLFAPYDLVVDGADNFPTRYLVNDAGVWLGKPIVHASVAKFEGQLTTFVSPRAAEELGIASGPCYRCLYPSPPPPHLAPSCAEVGVLGILPGVMGVLQATEALKLLLGLGRPLVGRLLAYDSLRMTFRELAFRRSPSCPVCGDAPTVTSYVDYEGFCGGAPLRPAAG